MNFINSRKSHNYINTIDLKTHTHTHNKNPIILQEQFSSVCVNELTVVFVPQQEKT